MASNAALVIRQSQTVVHELRRL